MQNKITKKQQKQKKLSTKLTQQTEEPTQEKPVQKVQKQKKNKADRLRLKEESQNDYGVIYIGRLPYGWVEEGIKEYFTQFGDVLGVKLYRSKKTNRSKGYGFVKFANREVAGVAAETMNGYMMLGKQLVSQLLDPLHPDPFKYKHGSIKLKFVNWQHKFIEESNKQKTNEQIFKEIQNLLKHEVEKRNKLQEMGIKYTYKGFKEILGQN